MRKKNLRKVCIFAIFPFYHVLYDLKEEVQTTPPSHRQHPAHHIYSSGLNPTAPRILDSHTGGYSEKRDMKEKKQGKKKKERRLLR